MATNEENKKKNNTGGGVLGSLKNLAGSGSSIADLANSIAAPINNMFTNIPKPEVGSSVATAAKNAANVGISSGLGNAPTFNYTKSDKAMQADAQVQQKLDNKPGDFSFSMQAGWDDVMNKILNREKFSYDLNGDALYQQYKDQYTTQGKLAMMDTMGQAAAMTGGYGNSYAQSAGQQAYQGYLQGLNDKIPELYQLALDKYNQEGQDLYNQYGLYADKYGQEYGEHRDSVSDYYTDLNYLTDNARYMSDTEYNQALQDFNIKYGSYRDAVSDSQWEQSMQWQKDRAAVEDEQWQKSFDASKSSSTTTQKNPSYGKLDMDVVEDKLGAATTPDQVDYIVSLYKSEGYNPDTLAMMARNAMERILAEEDSKKKKGNEEKRVGNTIFSKY